MKVALSRAALGSADRVKVARSGRVRYHIRQTNRLSPKTKTRDLTTTNDGQGYVSDSTKVFDSHSLFVSPTQLPPARGTRKRREGHRRRIVFLWPRGQRRYPHVQLEWHRYRSRTRTYSPHLVYTPVIPSTHARTPSSSSIINPVHTRTHARTRTFSVSVSFPLRHTPDN